MDGWVNKLYLGDNLRILRDHVPDESVDLIYLDPPFNSNATYNVLFKEQSGKGSQAQITAFEDTWHWGLESEEAYREVVEEGPRDLASLIQALRAFLGQNDMMAYLTMMAPRLVELHRVLKPTGSIYLHCDTTASHYLKLVMDATFGPRMFRNEIVWVRDPAGKGGKRVSRQWPRNFDVLLYYSKTSEAEFRQMYVDLNESQRKAYRYRDARGWYKAVQRGNYTDESIERLHAEGRIHVSSSGVEYVKYYLDEAQSTVGSVWTDIYGFGTRTASKERLGYPTQKPEALLERIIQASSNEGDVVLDPFCGCGTAVAVAERLSRRWIGIDITHLAIALMKHRLHDAFGDDLSTYEVIGAPTTVEDARALLDEKDGRFQFEWWALGLIDARPAHDKKKGADTGIDGYINFFDDASGKAKTVIVQVKSGKVTASQVRDLKGVLDREKAQIGAFISLEEPTKPMIKEAASAGFYEPPALPGKRYPRIQILTIREILDGTKLLYPELGAATFQRAQRRTKDPSPTQGSFRL